MASNDNWVSRKVQGWVAGVGNAAGGAVNAVGNGVSGAGKGIGNGVTNTSRGWADSVRGYVLFRLAMFTSACRIIYEQPPLSRTLQS
jgi:phage-related protein